MLSLFSVCGLVSISDSKFSFLQRLIGGRFFPSTNGRMIGGRFFPSTNGDGKLFLIEGYAKPHLLLYSWLDLYLVARLEELRIEIVVVFKEDDYGFGWFCSIFIRDKRIKNITMLQLKASNWTICAQTWPNSPLRCVRVILTLQNQRCILYYIQYSIVIQKINLVTRLSFIHYMTIYTWLRYGMENLTQTHKLFIFV